ncbi:divergent PAP2 family protein [Burkholderia ubonensis]|uniref:divergent PAP2 family protein n=1 Tax=Burkholderia ubonensis TaxID=101571 RepID=UPI00075401CD|nr:divergent PAP2 family protein [Burkholderia ubonensis]KVO37540.1 acid phosphatase [Burkholderia ubonensis]KVU96185.1 acid phosphatase [Burkholderia ubonensis]KVX87906.1 acid phosphatase [Burkholderia ubonensis]
MDLSYALAPLLAWLVAGILKFAINSIKSGKFAFGLIGYGGLPSNHSAIVSSTAALIAFKEGIGSAAFGVALTLAFVVMLDANSLRRQVGKHAAAINSLRVASDDHDPLRETMGHTRIEIAAGVVVGIGVAVAVRASI